LLRQELTEAEKVLWELLRGRKVNDLKFRRQHPLKNYIVDFFCYEIELVIELDGSYHNHPEQKEKDEIRDLHLKALGYKVLRFTNDDVFKDPKKILYKIVHYQEEKAALQNKDKAPLSGERGIEGGMKAPSPSRERAGVRVLSTKKLTPSQKNLILGAGFSVVEYDAIKIEFRDFDLLQELENLIFTSQNAVKAFLKKWSEQKDSIANDKKLPSPSEEGLGMKTFCVGPKTEALLLKNGLKVTKTAENASELADFIAKNYLNEHFYFFCGNKRRDELPQILTKNKLHFQEIEVYKTSLNNKKFEQKFDAVLFFSPSAVRSFAQQNALENTLAVCIGNTTAAEVQNYTDQFTVANATTIESVIARAVKALN